MRDLKYYIKSKEFIITTLILFIFVIVNIFPDLRYGYFFLEFKDSFAFWQVILTYGYGSYLQVILPLLVLFASLKNVYFKFTGSYLKNVLLKEKYSSFLKNEIFKGYIQAYIPLFLVVSFVLILSFILYPSVLTPVSPTSEYLYLSGIITNPYVYIIFTYLCRFFFVASIVNIGILLIYYTKKLYVSILTGFIAFHLINFLFQYIMQTIGYYIGGSMLQQFFSNFSLMQGYVCAPNTVLSLIISAVFFFITLTILYFVYKNKEKVVRNFEE